MHGCLAKAVDGVSPDPEPAYDTNDAASLLDGGSEISSTVTVGSLARACSSAMAASAASMSSSRDSRRRAAFSDAFCVFASVFAAPEGLAAFGRFFLRLSRPPPIDVDVTEKEGEGNGGAAVGGEKREGG